MKFGNVAGLDKPVSRLAQGTVPIGTHDLNAAFGLLDAVFEQGCNTFDTAHGYGGGDCERALAAWIHDRGVRDRVVILDKGAHHNDVRNRVTPYDIEADLHDSLARMKVDHIDLYILHRDDPSYPVGPIVETLHRLKQEGKIGAYGGSNWTHTRIAEANAYAEANGLTPFAASSPNYSLADQVNEPWPNCVTISGPRNAGARAYYEKTQLPVFAWSSLAGGFFSGRLSRETMGTHGEDYFLQLAEHCYGVEENFQRLDRARELAAKKGVSAAQIAMAYVMAQPINLFALVGCRNGDEFRLNAEALQLELTAEECAWLDLRA